jgi:hypothetical protein
VARKGRRPVKALSSMLYTCQLSVTLPNCQAPRLPRTPQDLQDTQAPSGLPALRRHSVPNPHNRHAAYPECSCQRPHRFSLRRHLANWASSDSLGVSRCVAGSSLAFILFKSLFHNPTHDRLVRVKDAKDPTHAVATRGVGLHDGRVAYWHGCEPGHAAARGRVDVAYVGPG